MASLAELILQSGRAAVELALFVLLPVMVVMLSIMRLMEARNLPDHVELAASHPKHPVAEDTMGVLAIINRAGAEALGTNARHR